MPLKQKQSGFALLLFMVVMIGFIIAGFSGFLTSSVSQLNEQKKLKNMKVLQQAKEALLSYAVNYSVSGNLDEMGKLPCPDVGDTPFPGDIEGNQDNPCGARGVNSVGYFPFRTIGSGKIEDSANECLWYVVSGDYKNQAESDLLNWDSVGYLNLVDENDNLKHGISEDDFPIAFIISPGATLNQNRTPDLALPKCRANYLTASYLEGGPNIDYGADLPVTADTLWEILTASEAVNIDSTDFNDQVIPIYRNELWDKIRQLGDLSFDTTAGVAATTSIELLTKSLAECIARYGNQDISRLIPYPAPFDLVPLDPNPVNNDQDEYRSNANYDDDSAIRFGRYPQKLDEAGIFLTHDKFVLDTSGVNSYCEDGVPIMEVTAYNELFWKNWKDHFFYIVSADFDPASPTFAGPDKCELIAGGLSCITVDGKADKIAAMVIFAGDRQVGQNRVWWWDDANSVVALDEKGADIGNYLEGDLSTANNTGAQNFNLTPTDYAYCIEYNEPVLTAIKCSDLDNL